MAKIMNGKGSKPRPYNKQVFDSNYEQINWHRDYYFGSDFIACEKCKKFYKIVDKNKYMVQDDSGNWICVKCEKLKI